jgi:serine/threonine-protein kinase
VRLTVETGPLAGTVVTLDRDHPTLLGSDPDCALRVQEPGVQGQHAVVKALRDQGFGLKALAPGVRVNGTVIEATPLQDGDVIELGTTRIAFGQVQKRGLPTIAGYRILGELGRGGMGMVYRAEQTSLHREVALKVLNRDLTRDPAFVAKFVAEARAAAKLQHPNVVQVFDVDNDGETYFYAMEVMHEGSLEGWLKQHGAMPVERALRVIADAASGLAYAESLGMVHRDIKPDNLMLDQHGSVKIADLGLAGAVEEAEETAIGTPHFMAPEQVLKKAIDHRTDLYALGCTFYRLVTGKTPFRGAAVKDILRAQVKDEAEPAHKANPAVPAEVGAIIQKLMAKEPGNRYQTANALLEEIELLLQPPAKKGLWIGLAAVAALVAFGAIYWAVTKPAEKEIVEKIYDDPEKQQFADEIKRLKKEQKQDKAMLALLAALRPSSGLQGLALADALDRVASDHADTAAAAEAKQLAQQLRDETAAKAREAAQRGSALADHLAGLQQAIAAPQAAHDYAGALRSLDVAPPAGLRDLPELARGLEQLRQAVQTAAKTHLDSLRGAVDRAAAAKDEAALAPAIEALATASTNLARWPASLRDELIAAQNAVPPARDVLRSLSAARGEAIWQQYAGLFRGADGVHTRLDRHDYTAAGQLADQFAATAKDSAAAQNAAGLAAAARHAMAFATALDQAIAAGAVQVPAANGAPLQVLRWDRAAGQCIAGDPAKKPLKEQSLPTIGWSLEQWSALADQVGGAPPGSRECFLGLVALRTHAQAAQAFLARVRAEDDASGTGADGYPLTSAPLDTLARRLPESDQEPWAKAMRRELQAALRLAAGLRALSERRNLAAASHLDKLLADYPHSVVVHLLP